MNILDTIIIDKKKEVALRKESVSIEDLQKSEYFNRTIYSLKEALTDPTKAGIIAEHKRKSPSKGVINDKLQIKDVTVGYTNAGASGLSVLTDYNFFGGSKEDLYLARSSNSIPILRKDFIIDEYQIIEAKSWGADVILLIASNLEINQTKALAKFAKELGLEVLLEIHNKEEALNYVNEYTDIVGVNNRNLKTFEVNINTSLELAEYIPKEIIKVAESGLNHAHEIVTLRQAGFKGFLIGEQFMKTDNPGFACEQFINQIMNKR